MLSYILNFFRGEVSFISLFLMLASTAFVVFCATPLHEFAHALIAVKLGDDTPRLRGRLTVNPTAHIDPMGALMIFLFGFGYAKPVEVRMRNFNKPKRDMALVALGGPLCNILQGLVFLFLFALLNNFANSSTSVLAYLGLFFYFAATINVNLAVFNLLPIPPLDGSRLLTALLPSKYYYKIMQYERYIMLAMFLLLFTGALSTPMSILSNLVFGLLYNLANLPFGG